MVATMSPIANLTGPPPIIHGYQKRSRSDYKISLTWPYNIAMIRHTHSKEILLVKPASFTCVLTNKS